MKKKLKTICLWLDWLFFISLLTNHDMSLYGTEESFYSYTLCCNIDRLLLPAYLHVHL